MEYKTLLAKNHLDFPQEFKCRFIYSKTEREVLHNHEYYEIFLTLTDKITHFINSKSKTLPIGSLVFVRPKDVHMYTHEKEPYRFINLAFSTSLADSLFDFLANDMDTASLLNAAMPPMVILSSAERRKVERILKTINTIDSENHKDKKLLLKGTLFRLFTDYFKKCTINISSDIPLWLSQACEQMQSINNFREGIPAMVRICEKSYEHLSRSLKKYYGITVSEYINDLRMNYAANLLLNSNFSITEIYLECGIDSPSWFATCFKKKYGVSPSKFRSSNGACKKSPNLE